MKQKSLQLAALSFCETASSCGHCAPCRAIQAGHVSDVLTIRALEDEDNIKLEAAQSAIEHLTLHPSEGRARVLILEDCDQLTRQAANSLLKAIEEPSIHARIILTSRRLRLVLPTIQSRAVKWLLPPGDDVDQDVSSDQELSDQVTALLESQSVGQILAIADAVGRQRKRGPLDLLLETERTLNKIYRSRLLAGELEQHRRFPSQLLLERRHRLAQAWRIVRGSKITLNTQLLAEGVGLAGMLKES